MRVTAQWPLKFIALAALGAAPIATAEERHASRPDEALEAPPPKATPRPKFEPRQKFEGQPPTASGSPVDVPPPGPRLNHGFVGAPGTFHLCGTQGEASFLWPPESRTPKFYRTGMVYVSSEADGHVFQLTGRFYRVWFKLAARPDASGKYSVWVRNGDRSWALYELAVVAPRAP